MSSIEASDQWLSGGDCKLCRRAKYCNKVCKPAQGRRQAYVASLFAEAALNVLSNGERRYRNRMKMEDYHKQKKTFAIVDGRLRWASDDNCDNMSAREWLVENCGMQEADFQSIVRGQLFVDHAVLYVSDNTECVDMDSLPDSVLKDICRVAADVYHVTVIEIWNGAVPGEPGTIWKPREVLGTFRCE